MKNIKLIIVSIIAIITILFTICSFIFEDKIVDFVLANRKNSMVINNQPVMVLEANNENLEDIQNIRVSSVNNNTIMSNISSRSDIIRRTVENGVYVQVDSNENNVQTNQNDNADNYEEVITEINSTVKIEDVKISFNMDVSKPTGLSKEDFITLVAKMKYDKTGILEKNAGWIWECCQKYNVNEIFVLGICGIESGWCSAVQHQKTHNYASLMSGGKLIAYANDEQGFEAMIKLLGQKYLSPKGSLYHGNTITGVGKSYCNPTTWPKKVFTCMNQVFI